MPLRPQEFDRMVKIMVYGLQGGGAAGTGACTVAKADVVPSYMRNTCVRRGDLRVGRDAHASPAVFAVS